MHVLSSLRHSDMCVHSSRAGAEGVRGCSELPGQLGGELLGLFTGCHGHGGPLPWQSEGRSFYQHPPLYLCWALRASIWFYCIRGVLEGICGLGVLVSRSAMRVTNLYMMYGLGLLSQSGIKHRTWGGLWMWLPT